MKGDTAVSEKTCANSVSKAPDGPSIKELVGDLATEMKTDWTSFPAKTEDESDQM